MLNTYYYLDVNMNMIGKKVKKIIKIYDLKDGKIVEREFKLSIILDKNIIEKELIYPNKGINNERDLIIKFNVLY